MQSRAFLRESSPRVFPLSVWRARRFSRNLGFTNQLGTVLSQDSEWTSSSYLSRYRPLRLSKIACALLFAFPYLLTLATERTQARGTRSTFAIPFARVAPEQHYPIAHLQLSYVPPFQG